MKLEIICHIALLIFLIIVMVNMTLLILGVGIPKPKRVSSDRIRQHIDFLQKVLIRREAEEKNNHDR